MGLFRRAPAHSDAALQAVVGTVDLPLPNGKVITIQVPTLKQIGYFYRLLFAARAGDGEAFIKMVEEFPAALGIEHEVDRQLLPTEIWDIADSFFVHRRSGGTPAPTPTEPEANASASTT